MADLHIDRFGIRWPFAIIDGGGDTYTLELSGEPICYAPESELWELYDWILSDDDAPWPRRRPVPGHFAHDKLVDYFWEDRGDDVREDAETAVRKAGGALKVIGEGVDHG